MKRVIVTAIGVCLFAGLVNCGGGSSNRANRPSLRSAMVLELDASYVNGTYGSPGGYCDEMVWTDLSGNGNDGELNGFACNSTSGWVGNGTSSDPYRLAFNGSAGQVDTSLDVHQVRCPRPHGKAGFDRSSLI